MSIVETPTLKDSFRLELEGQIQLIRNAPGLGQDCSSILSNTRGKDLPEPLIKQIIGGGSSHDTYYTPFRWNKHVKKEFGQETFSLFPLVVSNSIRYPDLPSSLIGWDVPPENIIDIYPQHSRDTQLADSGFGTYLAWVGLLKNVNPETILNDNRYQNPRGRILEPWRFANLRESLLFLSNYESYLLEQEAFFIQALGSKDDRENKDWMPSSYEIHSSFDKKMPPFVVNFRSATLDNLYKPLVVFTPATW